MSIDYKNTVFLPRTSFPMRGNLREKEPELLQYWKTLDLYNRLVQHRQGKTPFILHDGPPYANGHIHLGTALNKILKDVVNRLHWMLGKNVLYIPGWDCHGLPIEWKVEEDYKKQGKRKEDVSPVVFRQSCRTFALDWVHRQREDFKRLGVLGDWDNPYLTLDPEACATIIQELGRFLLDGSLYKGFKPVMWSVVEQTALAEMEIEYQEKTSQAIYVSFPVAKTDHPLLKGASVLIWTTTPWTIPGNRGICYGPSLDYGVIKITQVPQGSCLRPGQKIVMAQALQDAFQGQTGIVGDVQGVLPGSSLFHTLCDHPLKAWGYDFPVPLLPGDHVTVEAGTGLVHTAPGHGEEDFVIGKQYDLEIPDMLTDQGLYRDYVPLFAGLHVFKADTPVMEKLREAGCLAHHSTLVHSYPHSWRSKAPLIFRATPQWFISMDRTQLRQKALKALSETHWIPSKGEKRLHAMVVDRPDWCLSRQRLWGVPLPLFLHRDTGDLLRDARVHERIVKAFEIHGADCWYTQDPRGFLEPDYDPQAYDPVHDILDVWFESGTSHAFVLEKRQGLHSPADLYLEGSDQHRGWFQSSLLESCGTRDQAPFKSVLTHGFVLDAQGRKMSKSLGNTILPQDVIKEMGAEILRLWCVSGDFTEDVRISKETLKHQQDLYRRLRNTLRYLLGALEGFDPCERLSYETLPNLEKWVLHRMYCLQQSFQELGQGYALQKFYSDLHGFCSMDLSAYYFDIRKDTLYCDSPESLKRRGVRTVFESLLHALICWLSPVLCFTAEEAYLASPGRKEDSLSLEEISCLPETWHNPRVAEEFEDIRKIRRLITGALEMKRAQGDIGSSLQAFVTLFDPKQQGPKGVDWCEQAIISGWTVRYEDPPQGTFTLPDFPFLGVDVTEAQGQKCVRCWQVVSDVGVNAHHQEVCGRCAQVVEQLHQG